MANLQHKCNCLPQVEQELQCPFYAAGIIVTEEAAECADDFMEVSPSKPRRLPDCSHHCCHAQETTGEALPG